MTIQSCAFVIFYDLKERLYMLSRTDHLHPERAPRHKLKAVGGKSDFKEAPLQTVLREVLEEHPGWMPAANLRDEDLEFVGELVEDGWSTTVFISPANLSRESYRHAVQVATEGTPECWGIDDDLPSESHVCSWFYGLLSDAVAVVREKT